MSTPGRLSTADLATADQRNAVAEPIDTRVEAEPQPATTVRTDQDAGSPLFAEDASQGLWHRWDAVQAAFVDDPRHAVQDADALVADTMKRLAEIFAKERDTLEGQWARGDDVSTEDLRIALQRYRSFFKRLLSV